ncbi:hypothetical protein K8I61_19160 [bacterium]|nr:hypothetical protein [bacterium]
MDDVIIEEPPLHHIHRMCAQGLNSPFSKFRLNAEIGADEVAGTPFLRNARTFLSLLLEAGGTPATATGNLNRKFVRELFERMDLDARYREDVYFHNKVINEPDVWPLHIVRVVCDVAGLCRKYKKRFQVTKLARGLLADDAAGRLYWLLFETYFEQFDTGYVARHEGGDAVQTYFPYSLFRLRGLAPGAEMDIRAVPYFILPAAVAVRLDAEHPSPYVTAEHYVYSRVLAPLAEFGLLEIMHGKHPEYDWETERAIRKTPLFDRFVKLANE